MGKPYLAFIGPLPPPLGGVTVMNSNLQQLLSADYELERFNTSSHNQREDLYGAKGFTEVKRLFKTWIACFRFLKACRATLVNVFATSNIAFLRDAVIILRAKMHGKKCLGSPAFKEKWGAIPRPRGPSVF